MAQLHFGFSPVPGFAARDFVVSQPNTEAWSKLLRWPGPEGGALALIGPRGSGKSHLAAIWAERTGARPMEPADAVAVLADAPAFMVVEDADAGFDSASLFHLINLGQRPGSGLLITARTPPSTWVTALPDLRSRLNALPVAVLDEPDDPVLEGMLLKAFRGRRILPSQDLVNYLLRRIERSAAAAEAAVLRLDEEAAVQGRPVGRRLARTLFDADAAP